MDVPSTCPVLRPEQSVGQPSHPCLSPGSPVCLRPGSASRDREASAEAGHAGTVLEEAFLRHRGGKKGADAPPGAHLQARRGSPIPSQMRPRFHPSRGSRGLLHEPRSPVSTPPEANGVPALRRGASHGSFLTVVFQLAFSPLNFILIKLPDSRCWSPPMPITNTSPCWWRVLGEATPSQTRGRLESGLGAMATPCSSQ